MAERTLSAVSPRSKAGALVRAARPRQWSKNVLVFAVPAAAGALDQSSVLTDALLTFAAFCLVSSGTYLLNDASDVEADRLHPVKRFRPIAAGQISVRFGIVAGVLGLVCGCVVAVLVEGELLGVVGGYVLLTTAYTRILKHLPVFDIAAVAAGFFLRAVAGGVASDLYVSRWFLIVAGGGSLFLIIGKRYAEVKAGGDEAARRRPSLAHYSLDYLRSMLSTATGVTVLAYCLWAFEGSPSEDPSTWTAVSTVPFALGIMRYGLLLDQGHGEEPEQVVAGDRTLQGLGVVWILMLGLGVLQ